MSLNAILSDNSLTVTIKYRPITITSSDPAFDTIRQMIIDKKPEDQVAEALNRAAALAKEFTDILTLRDGRVYLRDGREINDVLAKKFLEIKALGMDTIPWGRFVENVYANPSQTAINELFLFLEHAKLPLTEDGCFIAYKRVNSEYKDCYTGTIDNRVGADIPRMDRDDCDPDRHRTCSTGYHFCSWRYIQQFRGAHLMAVKINPRDVTAIPSDYSNTKGRCCWYEVVGEVFEDMDKVDETYFEDPIVRIEEQEPEPVQAEEQKPFKKLDHEKYTIRYYTKLGRKKTVERIRDMHEEIRSLPVRPKTLPGEFTSYAEMLEMSSKEVAQIALDLHAILANPPKKKGFFSRFF